MRRGEIVKLKPKHIHLEERILSVVDGKTGDRSVPLTTRAVELLRESLEHCHAPCVSRLFPVTPHSVSTAFRRARKKLGLDDDIRLLPVTTHPYHDGGKKGVYPSPSPASIFARKTKIKHAKDSPKTPG